MAELIERIAAKIDRDTSPTGCWLWTASKSRLGYGYVWWQDHWRLAHRVVYEVLVGPHPEGLELDHLCRNASCVNPDHLEPVTHRENCLRGEGLSALHARKTHCPQGHPYDEANTYLYEGARQCRACFHDRYLAKKARRDG